MRSPVVVVLAAGLLLGGCARPVEPAVFGELSVTRSGGVAGLHDQLRVGPDGLAVELSPDLRAGRLSADRMAQVRRLLESDDLAREALSLRRDDDRCSDTIVTTVRMGAFSVADPGSCDASRSPATPALDELLGVVADARRGAFDEPLTVDDTVTATVRVVRPATAGRGPSTTELGRGGTVTLRRAGGHPQRGALADEQREGVAVVVGGLLGVAPTACSQESAPTIEVVAVDGRRVRGSACGFGTRRVDAYALVAELDRAVDPG